MPPKKTTKEIPKKKDVRTSEKVVIFIPKKIVIVRAPEGWPKTTKRRLSESEKTSDEHHSKKAKTKGDGAPEDWPKTTKRRRSESEKTSDEHHSKKAKTKGEDATRDKRTRKDRQKDAKLKREEEFRARELMKSHEIREEANKRARRSGRATRSASKHHMLNTATLGRTALQSERDTIFGPTSAASLDADIKSRMRPDLRPRGIENPGNYCYLNSVLQSFMHMPRFLHWIHGHRTSGNCDFSFSTIDGKREMISDPCVKCNMKGLVNEYWGATDPSIPIRTTSPWLRNVKLGAHPSIHAGNQEDANEAYDWLLEKLGTVGSAFDIQWTKECDALFQLCILPRDICQSCLTEREMPLQRDTFLDLSVANGTSIREAVHDYFTTRTKLDHSCRCASSTPHGAIDGPLQPMLRYHVIRAAPRILRIRLQIFSWSADGGAKKIFKALSLNEQLDLTAYQQSNALKLKYKLSSIISHSGNTPNGGHYMSRVRGQGRSSFFNINDDVVEPISHTQFTENPQLKSSSRFQAYVLTYIRDESALEDIERRGHFLTGAYDWVKAHLGRYLGM